MMPMRPVTIPPMTSPPVEIECATSAAEASTTPMAATFVRLVVPFTRLIIYPPPSFACPANWP